MVWCGMTCLVWYGCGVAWYGVVWHNMSGVVWYGMVWHGISSVVWCGMTWYGMVYLVWCGMVWHGISGVVYGVRYIWCCVAWLIGGC